MSTTPLLSFALYGDAAVCAASGLLLAAGAGMLEGPLGLPAPLLRWAGIALLPWAAFVGFTGRAPRRGAVLAVIAVNLLWVLDSLLLAAGAFGLAPTALGIGFVLAQAVVAAGFTALQAAALRLAPLRGVA